MDLHSLRNRLARLATVAPPRWRKLTTAEARQELDRILDKIDALAAAGAPAAKLTPAEAARAREIDAELEAMIAEIDENGTEFQPRCAQ